MKSFRAETRDIMGRRCKVAATCAGVYRPDKPSRYLCSEKRTIETIKTFDPAREGWVVGCSYLPVGTYRVANHRGPAGHLHIEGSVPVLRVQFEPHLKPEYAFPHDVQVEP